MDLKPTNPKDAIGSKKLAMHLVPSVVQAYAALGFTEGALKYGKYNWRVAGVRVSIYLDAIERHLAAYQNGEWADSTTHVPHLASVICCVGIILDASLSGKLTDDRPPSQPGLKPFIDSITGITEHLQSLFRDHNPHQHTIMDEEWQAETTDPVPLPDPVVATAIINLKNRDTRSKNKKRGK